MKRRNFLSSIAAVICTPTTVLATPLAPVSLLQAKEVAWKEVAWKDFNTLAFIWRHPSQAHIELRDNGQGYLVPVTRRDNCYDHSNVTFSKL